MTSTDRHADAAATAVDGGAVRGAMIEPRWWGEPPGRQQTWPSPRQTLLLQAALLPGERGIAAWRRLRPTFELPHFDSATQAVLPALHRNLVGLGVDDPVLPRLKGIRRHAWVQNQRILHELVPVVAMLERAGIRTGLLKGGALLASGLDDAVLRPMSDLDVLVPTVRFRDAIDVLDAAGFVSTALAPRWYVERFVPRYAPSFPFRHGDGRSFDLHWHALHWCLQPDADDSLWAGARPVTVLGVDTVVLAPADQLLQTIVHGLRWSTMPTYRWVLDATVILRGDVGAVDFDRLVAETRARRLIAPVQKALSYLVDVFDAPVPRDVLDRLGRPGPSVIERVEMRAQMQAPYARSRLEHACLRFQQGARSTTPLGTSRNAWTLIAELAAHVGIERWSDVPALAAGRRPSCPARSEANAVLTGPVGGAEPLGSRARLSFRAGDEPQRWIEYGTWLPDAVGTWTAGGGAALRFPLASPPNGSLVMRLDAAAFVGGRHRRQRAILDVNGRTVGRWTLTADQPALDDARVLVPADALRRASGIRVRIRTPQARSPAEVGVGNDDRRVGLMLGAIEYWPVPVLEVGTVVDVSCAGDEHLGPGWSYSESDGRWTVGASAQMCFGIAGSVPDAHLWIEVNGLAPDGAPAEVRVRSGRGKECTLLLPDVAAAPEWHRVPLGSRRAGEVIVTVHVPRPISPAALGLSADPRALGLLLRRFALVSGG